MSSSAAHSATDTRPLPLAGVRVLDYAQYVAGPFAAMLLADLGADVIKVEPPAGDAWRHYDPATPDGGSWFFALNRNKRSVVADLRTDEGRRISRTLIETCDVVVHNMPAARAELFGLARETVREINPSAIWASVSAFGTVGPDSAQPGYDLIAQAVSGLLLADVRLEDAVPRRSGGIAMADLTAGLLLTISVLAGLADRTRAAEGEGRGFEVSLLGAALAVQVQRFVAPEEEVTPYAGPVASCRPERLGQLATRIDAVDELEPYYRCYRASDGFLALACLNARQRLSVQAVLGVSDPYSDNPQRPPNDESERQFRASLKDRMAAVFVEQSVAHWLDQLRAHNVPCGVVHTLDQLHADPQVVANGLVQKVHQPGLGEVSLLGSLFKIDGVAKSAGRAAPALGAHQEEVLGSLTTTSSEGP